MKKIMCFICVAFWLSKSCAQNITAAEYFFDNDPGPGMGIPIVVTPGTTVNFVASVATTSLSPGFHVVAIRTRDANGVWGLFESRPFYISVATASAAAITQAEYFFDNDPGLGAGVPLSVGTSGSTVNFTAAIPTASLSPGFHVLAIRTRNADGVWSLFESRPFFVSGSALNAGAVTAAEYFIDTDPGTGNGTPVSVGASGNTVNFTASIPVASLSSGMHTLAIRTRNTEGAWSLFETRPFYVSTQTANAGIITAAEYFIDSDPGVGNGSALTVATPGNAVNQTFLVNVPPGTSNGQHWLAIRTRDANGLWSLFESSEFTVSGPLPLDWISFTGSRLNEKAVLKWTTENEINTSHFVVERSRNGADFGAIGQVTALGNQHNSYSFDDNHPAGGVNFYRLKQVDQNGGFKYSPVVRIFFGRHGDASSLVLYPNPVKNWLSFEFSGTEKNLRVQVFDATGKLVWNRSLINQPVIKIAVDQLAKGSYWIVVSDGLTQQKAQFVKSE